MAKFQGKPTLINGPLPRWRPNRSPCRCLLYACHDPSFHIANTSPWTFDSMQMEKTTDQAFGLFLSTERSR
jgi:hypothetical protein